jgi:hypothetical protein
MRKVDFRKGQRLGRNDALFVWKRSETASKLFSPQQWRRLPETIQVRVIRFRAAIRGHRARRITLATTLLDPKLYPPEELAALYARRWSLELCLRDLKTTLGMEMLRCKTPAMVRKEIMTYLLAHNLMRCLIADVVARYAVALHRVSFKGTTDAFRQYTIAISAARNRKMREQLWADMLANLARDKVPLRPGRQEPRALKQRPKNFGWLTKPRQLFKGVAHRNRYWLSKRRDYRGLN